MINRSAPCLLLCVALLQLGYTGCTESPKPVEQPRTQVQANPTKEPQPPQTQSTTPAPEKKLPQAGVRSLFKVAVEPTVYELPVGALATWRDYAGQKPALLLFSAHPLLDPIPAAEQETVRQLVLTGTAGDIIRRGRLNAADTVFISPQTVSAAIDSGLIAELIYVLPTPGKLSEMSLPEFQKRVFHSGFLTDKEALALTMKNGVISGTVRGLPLRCVHPEALPKINRPVLVHVDLGYFKNLYVNEVKTPAYDLLYRTAASLHKADYPVLAVTLSYSNQEAEFGLESRFLISNLADLLRHPSMFEGNIPVSWKLRSDALYAGALFSSDKAMEFSIKAAETNPDDPAALYLLALIQLEQRQSAAALATLDRAVALDPGYALQYLDMADAWQQADQVLALREKAAKVFADNPIIRIQIAELLINSGKGKEALPIILSLQQLPWSTTYHPDVPEILKQMATVANSGH